MQRQKNEEKLTNKGCNAPGIAPVDGVYAPGYCEECFSGLITNGSFALKKRPSGAEEILPCCIGWAMSYL